MHVLLVDDEVEYLEIMKSRLEKRGMHISVASQGEQALALAQDNRFDVAVLDVKMPGMDGMEVLRRLKKMKPELSVLLLTGHASMESAIAGVEMGAADYLLKPVSINDLITRLNDLAAQKA